MTARTIADIKQTMTRQFLEDPVVQEKYGFDFSYGQIPEFDTVFSKVSLESIFFYIATAAMHFHETLFVKHREEVETIIANQRPHTLRWYVDMAKKFQYGVGVKLIDGKDYYDNTGKTDEEIERQRIVKHTAAIEAQTEHSYSKLQARKITNAHR